MTVAVDLVAVRRARDALRALAAAHPELTAAATRHRAAAWMHDQEHNEMSRKLNDEQTSTAEQIGVRLPPDLLARLDAEAARLSALTATPFTRSMVVRSVLSRALPMLDGTTRPTTAQEAAQSPTPRATTAKPRRRPEPAAAPPAPAREADDDDHQLPLLDAHDDAHDRRNAAQAALLDAAQDRHDRRSAEHSAMMRGENTDERTVEQLRTRLKEARAQTGLSYRKLGALFGCSDSAIIQLLDGRTENVPRWAPQAWAWLDALK